MLKRTIESELMAWKNNPDKKCLMIEGARQVGKTYIIKHFAQENYKHFVELNFITSPSYGKIFDGDLDMKTILANISLYTSYGEQLVPHETLIFLDEIEACPNARTALKFFALDGRFDVISSGSMLGISYSKVASYPTGYVEYLKMHPLSFEEFLWASGVSEGIISMLKACYDNKEKVNDAMNDRMLELFRQYIVIGGMPDVVNGFVTDHNYATALTRQRSIVKDYENDIAKYAVSTEKVKARACFRSVPAQLSKENKKFMYGVVEKNSKSSKYSGSINWLIDAGIVTMCKNLSALDVPLVGYAEEDHFKMYMADTGLLVSMLDDGTNAALIDGNLGIYKGAVFENVIAQILTSHGIPLYYYQRNHTLELDFVLAKNARIVPVEVKAENNKAKSLRTALNENADMHGLKFTSGNIGENDRMLTCPLYMAMFL